MAIKVAPIKAAPAVLCDWVELRVLANPRGFFRLSNLKRFRDTHRESEDSDSEGQRRREDDTDEQGVGGGDDDAFLDSITDELSDRMQALADSYPFEFDASGVRFSLKAALSEGAYVYIFCLMLSNPKRGELLDGTWLPSIDNQTRDLFQACATLAAAGDVRGCAISFGWPRPNKNPPFLKRLQEVYRLFGEGTVVEKPRRGVSPCPKDEEIDIIAWRPRADKSAGTDYLLGQVASGDNWEAKSIKGGAIASFHHNWFVQAPPSEPKASIFVPHHMHASDEGSRSDRMNVLTAKYGIIIDRLRLPRCASNGISLADGVEQIDGELLIERRDDLPKVQTWVNNEIVRLRAAAATTGAI